MAGMRIISILLVLLGLLADADDNPHDKLFTAGRDDVVLVCCNSREEGEGRGGGGGGGGGGGEIDIFFFS